MGAEREGLPADVVEAADVRARIPLRPDGPESLNAAMAATVGLYELGIGSPRWLTPPHAWRRSAPRREAAIAAAGTAAELEELRVRYLGRKAELTTMLRSIGELPPEQRGPGGQGRQRGQGRARGPARPSARTALEAAELDERLRGGRDRRDAARRPAAPPPATCT